MKIRDIGRWFSFAVISLILIIFLNVEIHSKEKHSQISSSIICNKDSLIAYWSFDDSTARDFSGNGYDARIVNNPKPIQGIKGAAFYFNGKGDYFLANEPESIMGDHIRLPFIDLKQLSEFTITLWVKEDDMTHFGGEAYFWISDSHDDGWLGIADFCNQYPIYDPNSKVIRFAVGAGLINNQPLSYEFKQEFKGQWKFYTLVYQNNYIYAYIDGKYIDKLQQNVNISGTLSALACHWWYYNGEHRKSTRFTGAIDEVKIWCKALNKSEILKEMNICNKDNLIAYWSFDDSTAKDFSGNGLSGIMVNNPTPVVGVFNKGTALHFEGYGENTDKGSHILLPPIDFAVYPEFSVSLWVNEEGFSTWHGDAYIFFGDWTYGWLGITNHFNHKYYDGKLETNFTVGSIMHDHQITVPFDKDKERNKWKHYCMTYSNSTLKAYIDGEYVGENVHNVKIHGTNAGLNRSWWESGTITSTRFIGSMDEVKIYCKALSPCEIKNIYSPNYSDKKLEILGKKTICPGHPTKLYLSDKYKEVVWSNGDIGDTATITSGGKYNVRAFDKYDCEYYSECEILETDSIMIEINGKKTICEGDSTILSVIGDYKHIEWSSGDSTSSIIVKKEGTYSVIVIDEYGCVGIGHAQINVLPAPKPTFTIDQNSIGCKADSAILRSEDGFKGITWYYESLDNPIEYDKSEIVVRKSGKYLIKIRLNTGCEGIFEKFVDLVPIDDKLQFISSFDNGQINFDTVNILDIFCTDIKFKNISSNPAIIKDAYLLRNIDFSIPQSQFPVLIEPDNIGNIKICVSPKRLKQIYDTLIIQDTCNFHIIPLTCFSNENEWKGDSKCSVQIDLITSKLLDKLNIIVSPPFPNPASNNVTVSIYTKYQVENFEVSIFDIFGNKINRVNTIKLLTSGLNTFDIDLENLSSGIYFLKLSANGNNYITALRIIK